MRLGPQDSGGGSALVRTDLDTLAGTHQSVRDSADAIHQRLMQIRSQIETLKGGWKSASATAHGHFQA